MKLILAHISSRRARAKSPLAEAFAVNYVSRAARLCSTEATAFESEAALLMDTLRQPGCPAAVLVLFDSRGEVLTSDEFAELLRKLRDQGVPRLMLCVGPADGWSKTALAQARHVVSLGRMTLPHELARVVVAEQIYRALTILAGHPYHCGH